MNRSLERRCTADGDWIARDRRFHPCISKVLARLVCREDQVNVVSFLKSGVQSILVVRLGRPDAIAHASLEVLQGETFHDEEFLRNFAVERVVPYD